MRAWESIVGERAYPGDLRAGEALVGTRTGEIGESLWTAVQGGRILPKWGSKGVSVNGLLGSLGVTGPVDRAVLLYMAVRTANRTDMERETHLGRTGDGCDGTQVDTGFFYAVHDEVDGVEHGGGDLALVVAADGSVGGSLS